VPSIQSQIDNDDKLVDVKVDLLTIITNYSNSSLASLTTVGSAKTPQYQAYHWMVQDPAYWNYTEATILQRWVLAVFYYSTNGPAWNNDNFPAVFDVGKTPWLTYSDECQWLSTNRGSNNGAVCDKDNNIFALHLRSVGLNGTIPHELGLLSNLRLIFANNNSLTGSIPAELGQLTKMQKLQLSKNLMSGTLPSELGRLANLSVLAVDNNRFVGSIPTEYGQLEQSVSVGFENNYLSGKLPVELSNMILLGKFDQLIGFLLNLNHPIETYSNLLIFTFFIRKFVHGTQ
jgi:Leucine-rich repeat (LRR) protein